MYFEPVRTSKLVPHDDQHSIVPAYVFDQPVVLQLRNGYFLTVVTRLVTLYGWSYPGTPLIDGAGQRMALGFVDVTLQRVHDDTGSIEFIGDDTYLASTAYTITPQARAAGAVAGGFLLDRVSGFYSVGDTGIVMLNVYPLRPDGYPDGIDYVAVAIRRFDPPAWPINISGADRFVYFNNKDPDHPDTPAGWSPNGYDATVLVSEALDLGDIGIGGLGAHVLGFYNNDTHRGAIGVRRLLTAAAGSGISVGVDEHGYTLFDLSARDQSPAVVRALGIGGLIVVVVIDFDRAAGDNAKALLVDLGPETPVVLHQLDLQVKVSEYCYAVQTAPGTIAFFGVRQTDPAGNPTRPGGGIAWGADGAPGCAFKLTYDPQTRRLARGPLAEYPTGRFVVPEAWAGTIYPVHAAPGERLITLSELVPPGWNFNGDLFASQIRYDEPQPQSSNGPGQPTYPVVPYGFDGFGVSSFAMDVVTTKHAVVTVLVQDYQLGGWYLYWLLLRLDDISGPVVVEVRRLQVGAGNGRYSFGQPDLVLAGRGAATAMDNPSF